MTASPNVPPRAQNFVASTPNPSRVDHGVIVMAWVSKASGASDEAYHGVLSQSVCSSGV